MLYFRTFFDDKNKYENRFNDLYSVGRFLNKTDIINGEIQQPGSYIRADCIRKTGDEELDQLLNVNEDSATEIILLHEWGHDLHYQSCAQKIAPYNYSDYTPEMKEVMSISLERLAKSYTENDNEYIDNPHKTSYNLVKRIQKQKNIPFHKLWSFLLKFKNHQGLENYISLLEEYDIKIPN